MSYQETTATTLGNIHLELATVKFANPHALGCEGAGNYRTAQTHGGTHRGKLEQEGMKRGQMERGTKGSSHV